MLLLKILIFTIVPITIIYLVIEGSFVLFCSIVLITCSYMLLSIMSSNDIIHSIPVDIKSNSIDYIDLPETLVPELLCCDTVGLQGYYRNDSLFIIFKDN